MRMRFHNPLNDLVYLTMREFLYAIDAAYTYILWKRNKELVQFYYKEYLYMRDLYFRMKKEGIV